MSAEPLKGGQLALLTVALSLATFMQVLDTSIANVSIPGIAGDLAVSPSQGTWVITSFAVSNAIALPITGWLAKRFGEVKLFMASTLLFTIASWLCGLAPNLGFLVAFRILQGAVAGPMIPLSQSLLLANYPNEKKGMAMALWSMTVVVAPIFGPILGGWITDNISWPWIFYINIPVGLLSVFLTWRLLQGRETKISKLPIDKIGLGLLVLGVGSLQLMLDQGHEKDWFGSTFIVVLGLIAVVAISFLIVWELTDDHPIVDLRLFAKRNFAIGVTATSLGYMTFFGSVVIFPLWLQTQMGYTSTWAGLAAAPIGILAVVFSPIVGKNLNRFDLRILVTFAFVVFAIVSFWSSTFNTNVSYWQLIAPRLVQGVGMACFFIPLVTITLAGLPPDKVASASGLSNFVRILAGSFGTSLSISVWDHRESIHQSQLVENLTAFNLPGNEVYNQLQALGADSTAILAQLARVVQNQSVMMATDDVFWLSGWIFLSLIVLVWFAKPPFTSGKAPTGGGAH